MNEKLPVPYQVFSDAPDAACATTLLNTCVGKPYSQAERTKGYLANILLDMFEKKLAEGATADELQAVAARLDTYLMHVHYRSNRYYHPERVYSPELLTTQHDLESVAVIANASGVNAAFRFLERGYSVDDAARLPSAFADYMSVARFHAMNLTPSQAAVLYRYGASSFRDQVEAVAAVEVYARLGYRQATQLRAARARWGIRTRGRNFVRDLEQAHREHGN